MSITAHSPADVIAQLLINSGLGTLGTAEEAWPIFVARMPENLDNVISVFDTTGKKDGRYMRGGTVVERPGVLIGVRAQRYEIGYQKAKAIRDLIDATDHANVTIDAVTYTVNSISRTTPIVSLGESEERKNQEFSLNLIPVISE